jgi:hypothetical protein
MSGRSSGVEHNLAKVGVGRSNRLARSSFSTFQKMMKLAFMQSAGCWPSSGAADSRERRYLAFATQAGQV